MQGFADDIAGPNANRHDDAAPGIYEILTASIVENDESLTRMQVRRGSTDSTERRR